MDYPGALEILTAPWTSVTLGSRIILVLQLGALAAGVVPQVRARVRRVTWFVALIVGPPLLWTLLGASVGLILSADAILHAGVGGLYGLVRLPMIIATTLCLQCLLVWQYADGPLRFLPMIAAAFGLLAILGDIVFLLS